MKKACNFIYKCLASDAFFWSVIALLVLSCVWVALSAAYPLPFDEYYHFGITQIYSYQWSPVITMQPPEASIYGDITRFPSYLFHYLLSFPLRLFVLFTANETAQIIFLRMLNIGMVAGGFVLFRQVFLRANISKPIAHIALLMMALTPIVSLLGAEINYDNLLLLLTPLAILLTQRILQAKEVLVKEIVFLVCVGLLGSLVKYPFAVIFLTLCLYIVIALFNCHGYGIFREFGMSLRRLSKVWQVGLVILLLVAGGLFMERFGRNIITYNKIQPACQKVQSVESCQHYTPWLRNTTYEANPHPEPSLGSAPSFTASWLAKVMEGFYAPFSHNADGPKTLSDPFGPLDLQPLLPVQPIVAWVIAGGSGLLLLKYGRRLWQNKYMRLFIVVAGVYLAVLWLKNFSSYLHFGRLVAVQARYTLLVLPLVFVLIAQMVSYAFKKRNVKIGLASVVTLFYLQGAGAAMYILRSQPSWYWKNDTVYKVNQAAKKVLKPISFE